MRRPFTTMAMCAALTASAAVVATPAVAASPPVVTAVPASEPSAGAEGVITGAAMSGATAVLVGGASATILSNTSTSISVQFPPHDPGSVHVRVVTPQGMSAATSFDVTYYTEPATQTWTQTGSFDTKRGQMLDISCPTDTFCAAIDDSRVVRYEGTAWQSPVGLTNTDNLRAISCASATFCVAADALGKVRTYTGTTWSRPKLVDSNSPIADLSCPQSTWCVALDNIGIVTSFDGHAWAAPVPTGLSARGHISCAAATFCLAGDGTKISSWNGSSWTVDTTAPSGAADIDCFSTTACAVASGSDVWFRQSGMWTKTQTFGKPVPTGVACTSASSCTAVGVDSFTGKSEIGTWNGTSWTLASSTDVARRFAAVACATTSCFAVDGVGRAWSDADGSWGPPNMVIVPRGNTTSLSCLSVTFCIAADDIGTVKTWDGSRWSDPTVIDPEFRGFTTSCPTATFCMAVGEARYQTWNGFTWSAPAPFVALYDPDNFSCASAGFCLAITPPSGNGAGSRRWTGSTWLTDAQLPVGSPPRLSCPTATFCLTNHGLKWTPSGWTSVDGPSGLNSVDCVTASFCIGAGRDHVVFWHNGAWATVRTLDPLGGSDLVSCVTTSFCEVVDLAGRARVWDGSYWSDSITIDNGSTPPDPLVDVSCAAPAKCLAVSADATYESSPA
jgi:hypothetical protein